MCQCRYPRALRHHPWRGRIRRGKAGPDQSHLLFSAERGSQRAPRPARSGERWRGSRSCRSLRSRLRARACAEGAGRAAWVASAFPTPRTFPAVLLSARPSQTHVCRRARASVCVCVCSRQTVYPGRTGPVSTGGGGQLDQGPASVPSSPPQPFPLVALGRGTSSHSPAFPSPSIPRKRPAPCGEGSGSPRLQSL